jgi:acetyl esterase/lipase
MNAQSILDLAPPPAGQKLSYGPDAAQFAELRLPATGGYHPAVIVIHGGYWRAAYDLKHIGHLCAALVKEGFATWSIEYRRIGNPGGGWPGTLDDVREAAFRLLDASTGLKDHINIDLDRVIVMGHSAGGQLALWLAKGFPEVCARLKGMRRVSPDAIHLRGVVPLAPVADLKRAWELKLSSNVVDEFLGGSPTEVPERYRAASPIEMLPLGVPQRVIHGEHDDIVPISISRAYVAAAKSKGDDATLIEPPGAGHFELIDPRSSAWPVVRDTCLGLLK